MKIIRSKIQPIGKGTFYYWVDLSADKDGAIIKYYDSDTKKWLQLGDAEIAQLQEHLVKLDEADALQNKAIAKTSKELAEEIERAVKSETDIQKAVDSITDSFNTFISSDEDADTIVNRWNEVVKFLNNVSESDDLVSLLLSKVDKVEGKGLSTNDFTNDMLSELKKVPLMISDLSNNWYPQINKNTENISTLQENLDSVLINMYNKVNAVDGKGLSTNDYTDADKASVATIGDKLNISGGNITGSLTVQNNTVWNAGNDGADSGLDADLLDGHHASDFVLANDSSSLYNLLAYGIEFDTATSSPDCTRIGNLSMHKTLPIQSRIRKCIVKDGKVNYYLDANNSKLKADGTDAVLDGTDGDIMADIPNYYLHSETEGTKFRVWISSMNLGAGWYEVGDYFWSTDRGVIDRTNLTIHCIENTDAQYRGGNNGSTYDEDDVTRSNLGKPVTSINRTTFRSYCVKDGKIPMNFNKYCALYWLIVIEYATFNLGKEFNSTLDANGFHQGGLGFETNNNFNGTWWSNYNGYNPLIPVGFLDEFGNNSGYKDINIPSFSYNNGNTTTNDTLYRAYCYRGINMSHDIWTIIDGIVLHRDTANAASNVYVTDDVDYFETPDTNGYIAGTEVASDGWIKNFNLGESGFIIPSAVGGSSSTYMCDYHWCNATSTERRLLVVGGDAYYGSYAGPGCFDSYVGVGLADADFGFRFLIPKK